MEQLAIFGGKPVRDTLLPYGKQSIDKHDVTAVTQTLQSDFITSGPKVTEFEEKIAQYVGATYAVAFSSGTTALHGAAFAAGFGKGDEIITTPFSFAATSNCLLYRNATPVYTDISAKTFNLSYSKASAFIQRHYTPVNGILVNKRTGRRLKGIVPVHFAGHPVRMNKFYKLAQRYKLTLIEDAAHAFESSVYGKGSWRRVGDCSFSDMTMFSFHPVKHITTGEGGIITTNNRALYNRLVMFRSHGITRDPDFLTENPGPWYYEMQHLGNNYRFTDLAAALGLSQLQKSKNFLARRSLIAARYLTAFAELDTVTLPTEKKWARSSWHIFVIRLRLDRLTVSRDEIFKALRAENIGVNVHYIPIYRHPFYRKFRPYVTGNLYTTEKVYREIITLPLFPEMTDRDVQDVITAVRKVLSYYTRKR